MVRRGDDVDSTALRASRGSRRPEPDASRRADDPADRPGDVPRSRDRQGGTGHGEHGELERRRRCREACHHRDRALAFEAWRHLRRGRHGHDQGSRDGRREARENQRDSRRAHRRIADVTGHVHVARSAGAGVVLLPVVRHCDGPDGQLRQGREDDYGDAARRCGSANDRDRLSVLRSDSPVRVRELRPPGDGLRRSGGPAGRGLPRGRGDAHRDVVRHDRVGEVLRRHDPDDCAADSGGVDADPIPRAGRRLRGQRLGRGADGDRRRSGRPDLGDGCERLAGARGSDGLSRIGDAGPRPAEDPRRTAHPEGCDCHSDRRRRQERRSRGVRTPVRGVRRIDRRDGKGISGGSDVLGERRVDERCREPLGSRRGVPERSEGADVRERGATSGGRERFMGREREERWWGHPDRGGIGRAWGPDGIDSCERGSGWIRGRRGRIDLDHGGDPDGERPDRSGGRKHVLQARRRRSSDGRVRGIERYGVDARERERWWNGKLGGERRSRDGVPEGSRGDVRDAEGGQRGDERSGDGAAEPRVGDGAGGDERGGARDGPDVDPGVLHGALGGGEEGREHAGDVADRDDRGRDGDAGAERV